MMNRRWLCSDVWMDILPSFDHTQLGLKMALLSDRFDILVDTHFDGKSELTIWKAIEIRKGIGMPKLFVDDKSEGLPLPDRPLPIKIRFKHLHIHYIDHSVIEFLRANKPIWDRSGTNLFVQIEAILNDTTPIWGVFVHQIWPIFATNIRHLRFDNADQLNNLRYHISLSILTDLSQLDSVDSGLLCPAGVIAGCYVPNANYARQALSRWLHTPSKHGQPKRLRCFDYLNDVSNFEWVNNFKETFPRATTSVSYKIRFGARSTTQIVPFEVVNEQTKEKLILTKESHSNWLMKRCPISGEAAAAVQWENDENWEDNLNIVQFEFC